MNEPQTVEQSFHEFVVRIIALSTPTIYGEADGDYLRAVAEHMVEIADVVDAYFASLGRMVQSNVPVKVDQSLFEHPCFDAIGGNAIFEVNRAAEALDQERVS